MAKAEWGTKRVCLSCSARFYDMMRDPIVCPECETVFDPTGESEDAPYAVVDESG